MLKLTKKADYGLIALTHLAAHRRQRSASAKEIAERYNIPLPLLSKVLQRLARTGILAAEQGTKGGYRLARDPDRISALEVIKAIDGPLALASCFADREECHQSEHCTVREPLRKVHEGILNLLSGISITDITSEEPAAGWEKPKVLYSVGRQTQVLTNS